MASRNPLSLRLAGTFLLASNAPHVPPDLSISDTGSFQAWHRCLTGEKKKTCVGATWLPGRHPGAHTSGRLTNLERSE